MDTGSLLNNILKWLLCLKTNLLKLCCEKQNQEVHWETPRNCCGATNNPEGPQ